MAKKQKELFDIQENEETTPRPDVPAPAPAPKQKRSKKPLSESEKATLIQRLKDGRERKKNEREGKSVSIIEEQTPPATTTPRPPRPLTPHPSENEILKKQITDLKSEIKETKEKAELKEMRDELKELKKMLLDSNKKSNDNVENHVKPLPIKAVPSPSIGVKQPTATAPPIELKAVTETRLKKKFK
tara:strand:+ start:1068 stop:1628 length:561 start_codon:yes stop_codon:yes gene_type:complete